MEQIVKILECSPNPERGKNYGVYFMELADGSKAVWKPDIEEHNPSIVALKEIVAYQIDKWLGLNIVPETEFRRFEGRPGSLQQFIEGTLGTQALQFGTPAIDFASAQRLAVFDYLVNNCDRWPSNFIVDKTGHVWGIDNAGILQNRDAWTASSWSIVGIDIGGSLLHTVIRTRENFIDLVRTVFNIRFIGWHGVVHGTILEVGMHIMYEKLCCLAGGLGHNQSLYETWGCPEWSDIAEEAIK